jgi:lipopolysaccharide transport protein LptA
MTAMAATRPRPPFQRLRRVLLGAFAAVVLGVAGLYLLGRPSAPGIVVEDPGSTESPKGRSAPRGGKKEAGPPVVSSEGFEYEQRVGERSAFRLRGSSFSSDKEGLVALQGVGLDLTREDGTSYRVESRRATWDPRRREARLAGEVRLSGPRDFHLEGDRLDLVEGGQTVVSRDAVRFGQGSGLSGRAGGMRLQFETDRFLLQEKVRVSGRQTPAGPAMGLEADRVVYERGGHVLRAVGSVVLTTGDDRLRADQVDVELTDDDGEARRAVATGQVTGELGVAAGDPGSAGRAQFQGATLAIDFAGSPARPTQLDLEPAENQRVRAVFQAESGDVRTLEAQHLVVSFEEGRPRGAAASGGVRLTDVPATAAGTREATAQRAEAGFEDGELARVTLAGKVRLTQGDREATADRCEANLRTGSAVLTSEKGRVRAVAPTGELRAPRIVLEREHGVVRASGGVFAEMAPGQGGVRLAPASGDARVPTRVEASEAESRDEPRSWRFRGDVRGSQGESVLFADELTGTEPAGVATASGHVRTEWKQAPEGGGEATTTSVAADRLVYDRGAGRAEYTGGVRARQQKRDMSCDTLVVELDSRQRARRLHATGNVLIEDREAGRKVTGTSADHDVEARTILIEGEPVVLSEEGGTTVRGRHVLYDLAAGTARVLPEEGEKTP